jgi:hypothetical protein
MRENKATSTPSDAAPPSLLDPGHRCILGKSLDGSSRKIFFNELKGSERNDDSRRYRHGPLVVNRSFR